MNPPTTRTTYPASHQKPRSEHIAKTIAIDQPDDDGPINAIDWLLRNLPTLPNEKALITRDYKSEVEISSEQTL